MKRALEIGDKSLFYRAREIPGKFRGLEKRYSGLGKVSVIRPGIGLGIYGSIRETGPRGSENSTFSWGACTGTPTILGTL